ncbi:hypothetical protein ACGFY3_45635 [Streptomyces mirabilis]|uniref:hypothetical protein n=1 Tax=Streptomyces mirabilis TaxID=68239 RepID=UPI0037187B18
MNVHQPSPGMPTTMEGIVADLRPGAEKAGVDLTTSLTKTSGTAAVDEQRYHLILTVEGWPLMHGWWTDRAVANRKFRSWVGEYGSLPGAHIVLVDKEEGEALASWP